MTSCTTVQEPYSEATTTLCEHPPVPWTGAPETFPFLLWLGFAVVIVGLCAWWAGRVRKYR